jgi:uncharacterized protein YecE (DUF72 family)
MKAYLGTSGFSYPEWKGSFYPEKIKSPDMLSFYASQLQSVEINNTFYRMPRSSVFEGWRSQVHEDFRFAVKATRRITHFKKLADTAELLDYLLTGLAALGPCLGPVLFQLPPTLKQDLPLLLSFLESLPTNIKGTPLLPAFEFRHPSWFCQETYVALEKHGAALVGGDLDDGEKDPPLVRTSEFAYLRLRKTEYTNADLDDWAEKIRALNIKQLFAYFKHEEVGPELAAKLNQRLDE